MAVYVIGQITVHNTARWQDYLAKVGGTIAHYGGEVQFRGGLSRIFAGTPPGDKVVVIKFVDQQAADRWHDSPEYQSLVGLRDAAARVTLVSFSDSHSPDSP